MSNLTVKGNASGTGTVILEAPNTNSNRTITLPDVTTTLVGTDATQTLTNKSIAASQLTGALPAISGAALTSLPAPTSAQVGTATAALAYGDVGSYGLFQCISAGQRGGGSTVAGSSLYPANAFSYNVAGYASVYGQPSGTWRLMGSTGYYSGSTALTREDMHTSVWLRIS
jgi:hypothetical protein